MIEERVLNYLNDALSVPCRMEMPDKVSGRFSAIYTRKDFEGWLKHILNFDTLAACTAQSIGAGVEYAGLERHLHTKGF